MKSYLSRRMLLTLAAALGASMILGSPARADDAPNWSQWRGPNFDGSTTATNLPTEFSKDQNVLWKTSLPGSSNATPIVHGDRVFTTSIDENRKMWASCLDRKDGKILWQHEVGIAQIRPKGENDVAAPSPVTDGKIVVFLFGTGDLIASDLEGKQLWARNLQREIGEWNINWIYGSSPTLHKGKLYVQVLHTDKPYDGTALPGAAKYSGDEVPSYILALNPADGKEIWRVERPSNAIKETKESYATPVPHKTAAGREELLIVGGSAVTGHDPETGKEIWRYHGWDPKQEPFWRLIPSVVTGGGVILACAPKGGPVMAIKEGGEGDISKSHLLWQSEGKEISSDVPVPLYYKDHFFVLDHGGTKMTKVEPKTGKAVWVTKLEGVKAVCRASPTGADGKIYAMNVNGDVWVISPDDGKILHKTSLGGNKSARGSVAAVNGMILIREGSTLYAFGQK